MTQSIVIQETREALLRVEVIPRESVGSGDTLLRLSLPHGVVPSTQIGIQIDGGRLFKVPISSSDASGLYASSPIGADFVAAMREGRQIDVSLVLVNGTLATVPVSLFGFTAADDAIKALMEARHE